MFKFSDNKIAKLADLNISKFYIESRYEFLSADGLTFLENCVFSDITINNAGFLAVENFKVRGMTVNQLELVGVDSVLISLSGS